MLCMGNVLNEKKRNLCFVEKVTLKQNVKLIIFWYLKGLNGLKGCHGNVQQDQG